MGAAVAGSVLEQYANRGMFRGFAAAAPKFRVAWHRDRLFEFVVDERSGSIRIPAVLPQVPARSGMYGAYRQFIESRCSGEELPDHRRVDGSKARVKVSNRGGDVSVTVFVLDGDWEYAVRKLVHLVHETYLAFLVDGPYYEYMVEAFNLDPDHP